MSVSDRDPVSVASKEVHGPSFGMGTLGLVATLALGAGMILGGVIMPFLRSSPPDTSQSEKLEAEQASSRALLFSMYPQTIYASLREGGEVVSTGLSVEQYLTEIEVRASQAGLLATKMVERKGDRVEISYAFAKNADQTGRAFPNSQTTAAHPKSLVLIFSSGPLPATIALQKSRVDGRDRGAGATFVDLVTLGATPPVLGEGQFLTSRGVFEIKLTGDGVGAFLDDVLVYPAPKPKPGPVLSLPGASPTPNNLSTGFPRRLALQAFQPALGTLKDRLILVASDSADQKCGAKAIILDATRGLVTELPEPLQVAAVGVGNAKDAIIFSGFCVVQPQPETTSPSVMGKAPPAAPPPKTEVRLSARYDLKTGALTWQRESVVIAPPVPVSALESGVQTGAATPWRETGSSRLASPLAVGGGLVSVACRPGGGVTIALSGLSAPADGQAAGIRFSTGGASAVAQMRWRASAGGYELDGASRPNEARAILDRLRAGGAMTVSGAGGSKVIPAPGRAQIDRLVSVCGTPAPAATVPSVKAVQNKAAARQPTPKATPAPANKPKPKPTPSVTKAVTPKPSPPKPSPPPPKPKPAVIAPTKE